jgi:mono/diheme cytochrome c family protein
VNNSVGESLTEGVLVFLMGSCLFLLSCTAPPEGNSSDGKRWFAMQHCDSCHGKDGLGGKAPRIRKTELSYRELLSKVRKPKSATMPSFPTERLSDKEVADIFSYLQEGK